MTQTPLRSPQQRCQRLRTLLRWQTHTITSEMALCTDVDQTPSHTYLGLDAESLAAVESAADAVFFPAPELSATPLRLEHIAAALFPFPDFDPHSVALKQENCVEDPELAVPRSLAIEHQLAESSFHSGSIPDTSSDFSWPSACVSPAPSTPMDEPPSPEAPPIRKHEPLPVAKNKGRTRHPNLSPEEKQELRRKRNREASSRSYYRKRQRMDGARETLEAEKARAAELQAREHELLRENTALRNEIKWRTGPRLRLPKSFKLRAR